MHAFLAIDCPPPQHKALTNAINSRAYTYNKKRAGYNIPHISEIRFYNVRAKKEIMPILLKDLNAHNLLSDDFVKKWYMPLSNEHKVGIKQRTKTFFILTGMKLLRFMFSRANIFPPKISKKKGDTFVQGWHYVFCMGTMNDPDRGQGEEL
jgi:hypothetical protein